MYSTYAQYLTPLTSIMFPTYNKDKPGGAPLITENDKTPQLDSFNPVSNQ